MGNEKTGTSDWIVDLKGAILDRIGSPFLFPFFCGLIAINYRVVIVVFSQADYLAKIDYIDRCLHDVDANWRLIFYPLIVALVYNTLIPAFSLAASTSQDWFRAMYKRASYWVLGQGTVTRDEYAQLMGDFRQKMDEAEARVAEFQKDATNAYANIGKLRMVQGDRIRRYIVPQLMKELEGIPPPNRIPFEYPGAPIEMLDVLRRYGLLPEWRSLAIAFSTKKRLTLEDVRAEAEWHKFQADRVLDYFLALNLIEERADSRGLYYVNNGSDMIEWVVDSFEKYAL